MLMFETLPCTELETPVTIKHNSFKNILLFTVSPPLQGSYTSRTYKQSVRARSQVAPNSYSSFTPRLARTSYWSRHYVPTTIRYGAYRDKYNPKSIPTRVDPRIGKTIINAKNLAAKSYWTQRAHAKTAATYPLARKRLINKKVSPVNRGVQKSLTPKATVKKGTLSSNPRWTRSHKNKKQLIVANLGGLGLANGLGLGLTGTTADTYGVGLAAGLGTGYGTNYGTAGYGTAGYGTGGYGTGGYGTGGYGTGGYGTAGYGTGLSAGLNTGLSTGYGAGLGTMLATGYGTGGTNVVGSNAVLDARHNFGTNYGAGTTSNGQSQTSLSDLSAAGLNSLSSAQTGGNSALVNSYMSNLGGGRTSDLNSLSSYQNNGFDVLGNTANTASNGLSGLNSLTGGGLPQRQQYGDGNDNLVNSLEEQLNMGAGAGGRQGIGNGGTL